VRRQWGDAERRGDCLAGRQAGGHTAQQVSHCQRLVSSLGGQARQLDPRPDAQLGEDVPQVRVHGLAVS
jgi:hypothetical protein